MSQMRTFDLNYTGLLNAYSSLRFARTRAERACVLIEACLLNRKTIRLVITGNVDALDDLFWTLRDEFGERIREVKG